MTFFEYDHGIININHIIRLDKTSKTLILSSGETIVLTDEEFQKLTAHIERKGVI